MKGKNRIAYEFRENISLRYFLDRLTSNYEELDFSDMYKDPMFEAVSKKHPVYVLTTIGKADYKLTDTLPDDVTIINENNVQEFIDSLER